MVVLFDSEIANCDWNIPLILADRMIFFFGSPASSQFVINFVRHQNTRQGKFIPFSIIVHVSLNLMQFIVVVVLYL